MNVPGARIAKTILLVDDDDDVRTTLSRLLSSIGFVVEVAACAEIGLDLFNPEIHQLVITDNCMPGKSGLEMARLIKLRSPTTPIIMHTGAPPPDHGVIDMLILKPSGLGAYQQAVNKLTNYGPVTERRKSLVREAAAVKMEFNPFDE